MKRNMQIVTWRYYPNFHKFNNKQAGQLKLLDLLLYHMNMLGLCIRCSILELLFTGQYFYPINLSADLPANFPIRILDRVDIDIGITRLEFTN